MKRFLVASLVLMMMASTAQAFAQKDNEDDEPTCLVYFLVIKGENGKPVRNAAVIMHPVTSNGKQGHGGMELKTDAEGKANFDGIPYGKLRVQVLAAGFQTYGEDFDITKPKMSLTIKLKHPQEQYSIYDNHAKDRSGTTEPQSKPPDKASDKPN
jgi:Carboxypeptidase regulatory-like domain